MKPKEITPLELQHILKSNSTICLIDARDSATYKNGHLLRAELFNCTTRVMIVKAKKCWDKFRERRKLDTIIVYNQKGEISEHLTEFIEYLQKDVESIYFLKGGYNAFKECFGCKEFIVSSIAKENIGQIAIGFNNKLDRLDNVPIYSASEVLTFLYIGNEDDSRDFGLLKEIGITHVLNVTCGISCSFTDHFKYKRIPVKDSNQQDLRAFFKESIEFIDEARIANGKVFVHCLAGISRSPTIVAAYLLHHSNLTVIEALEFLKSRRSIVAPNFSFLGQLSQYRSDMDSGIELRSRYIMRF